jgi:hypothetical protein
MRIRIEILLLSFLCAVTAPLISLAQNDSSIVLIAPADYADTANYSQNYSMRFTWHQVPFAKDYIFSIQGPTNYAGTISWDTTLTTTDSSIDITLSDAAQGWFQWTVTAEFSDGTTTESTRLLYYSDAAPQTWQPDNGAVNVRIPVAFSWTNDGAQEVVGDLIIATDRFLKSVVAYDTALGHSYIVIISNLLPNTTYYWSVLVFGHWTDTAMFTTGNYSGVAEYITPPSSFQIEYSGTQPILAFSSANPGTIRIDAIDILGRVQHLVEEQVSAPSGIIQIPGSDLKVIFYVVSENGISHLMRAINE